MSNASNFWNSWAQRYAKQPIPDQAVYEEKLRRTQTFFGKSTRVLEFGCGTGSTALIHAPFVEHIHCIDFSENMIAIARQKADLESIENVSFEVNTLDAFDAEPQSFDVVLGLSILHLLDDWQDALKKVHSLLKPGGVFISSTPCLSHIWWLRYVAAVFQPIGLMPQLTFFTQSELASLLEQQGFSVNHIWQPKKKGAVFIIAQKPE